MKEITEKQVTKILRSIDKNPEKIYAHAAYDFYENQPYLFDYLEDVDPRKLNTNERAILQLITVLVCYIASTCDPDIPTVTEKTFDLIEEELDEFEDDFDFDNDQPKQQFDSIIKITNQPALMNYAISMLLDENTKGPNGKTAREKSQNAIFYHLWYIVCCLDRAEDYEYAEDDEDGYSDEDIDDIKNRVNELYKLFTKSPHFNSLAPEYRDNSNFIIEVFSDYLFNYLDVEIEDCDMEDMKECCLEILPSKVTADDSCFTAIAPVLSAFFIFMEDEGVHSHGRLLSKALLKIGPEIVKNSHEKSRWGMTKTLLMQGKSEGYNMESKNDIDKFIKDYNNRQKKMNNNLKTQHSADNTDQPGLFDMNKPGRNEPCPCGSGKKYKKCCGSPLVNNN